MVMEISVRDDKAELFLQLVQELKSSVIERFQIISPSSKLDEESFFDETELESRIEDIKKDRVKSISREEVFDGI